jgi:chromosome segregation ATPase
MGYELEGRVRALEQKAQTWERYGAILQQIEQRWPELRQFADGSGNDRLRALVAEIERSYQALRRDLDAASGEVQRVAGDAKSAIDEVQQTKRTLGERISDLAAKVEQARTIAETVRGAVADVRAYRQEHPDATLKEAVLARLLEAGSSKETLEHVMVKLGIPSVAAVLIAGLLSRRIQTRIETRKN